MLSRAAPAVPSATRIQPSARIVRYAGVSYIRYTRYVRFMRTAMPSVANANVARQNSRQQ